MACELTSALVDIAMAQTGSATSCPGSGAGCTHLEAASESEPPVEEGGSSVWSTWKSSSRPARRRIPETTALCVGAMRSELAERQAAAGAAAVAAAAAWAQPGPGANDGSATCGHRTLLSFASALTAAAAAVALLYCHT